MVGFQYLGLMATVLGAVASAHMEEDWVLSLLKRQEPGTPAYACHSACGTAITQSRGADPCNTDAFVENYEACLVCAGPDDINIWRYYGATLTVAGTKCGFSTTPGPQAPTTPTTTAAPSAEVTTTAPPALVTTTTPPAEETTTTSPSEETISVPTIESSSTSVVSPSTTASVRETTSSIFTTTAPAATGTGSPIPTNGTSTTSIEFTGAGNSVKGNIARGLGAVAIALAVAA